MGKLMELSIFSKKNELTREEKIEIAAIVIAGLILTALAFYFFTPVFAYIGEDQIAEIVKTVLIAICSIVGGMFVIIGLIKFIISHANEDGPAQQKAIMMLATGIILIAVGVAIGNLITGDMFKTT